MKNEYEIREEDTAIFIDSLRHGRIETIISTSSLESVKRLEVKWCVYYENKTKSFYVYGSKNLEKNKSSRIGLHRWIMGMPYGMEIDHVNHDTLDNRLSNLRVVTQSENQQNRKGATSKSSSGILGVHWHKASKAWSTQLRINGVKKSFGYYKDIEEASRVIKEARRIHMPFSS